MKQTILLSSLIVLGCIGSLKAQVSKGSIWLGGGASFMSQKDKQESNDISQKQTGISPGIGVAVKDNLVVGVEFLYSSSKSEGELYSFLDKYENIGGGVFVRKYIPLFTRFYLFGHGSAAATSTKVKKASVHSGEETGKGWSGTLALRPGVSFALNKKLQLETGMGNLLYVAYTNVNYDRSDGTKKESEYVSGGISSDAFSNLYVGLRFLL